MNEKNKNTLLYLLIVLIIALIIIIGALVISIRNKEEYSVMMDNQVQNLMAQQENLQNQLDKEKKKNSELTQQSMSNNVDTKENESDNSEIDLNEEKVNLELPQQSISNNVDTKENESDNSETDLNEEKVNLLRKLLLEEMPSFSFKNNVQKDKYKVVGKYINSIEIYSEPYVEKYYGKRFTKEDNVYARGSVSFTTEYDRNLEEDDVNLAGGSLSMMIYKNYMVQKFYFDINQNSDGKYELELNTGR